MVLAQFGQELTNPFVVLWSSLIQNLPGIVAAIVVLVLGYLIAIAVGFAIKKIVEKTKVDKYLLKVEQPSALGGLRLSTIVGKLIKWWVFILFLTPAANLIKLEGLSNILTQIALWLPHLIVGIIIMIIGLMFADFLAKMINQAKSLKKIKVVSYLARSFVVIFFTVLALKEIGVNIFLAETTLLMVIGGFILILVIGFGIGLIKPAQELISVWMKRIK